MADGMETVEDLLAQVRKPRPVSLDCGVFKKGNDNYHIDVQLSDRFVLVTKEIIEAMSKRAFAGKRPQANNDDVKNFRAAYVDIINDTLHRTKTDLQPAHVRVLHFAIIKYVLSEVKARLDTTQKDLEETLGQQQFSGSRSLLVTQEQLGKFRKHYANFQFRISRAVMRLIQREESQDLRALRQQFIGDAMTELPNILLNPMLAAGNPRDLMLMVDSYAIWPEGGKAFDAANARVEDAFAKRLDMLPSEPLKKPLGAGPTEIYDEFGGLFAVQQHLGPAIDQKDDVEEEFTWLDHPGNLRLLLDPMIHERTLAKIDGRRAQWKFKSETKKFIKYGIEAVRALASDEDFRVMVAGYHHREEWVPAWDDYLDIVTAAQFVAGHDQRKILTKIDQSKEGAILFVRKLEELAKETNRAIKEDADELRLRVLCDLARYRLHLKYFRMTHRIFNRINVLTDPQEIQLSKANDHLYQLLGGDVDETVKGDPQIIHHTVLKADVRGSTTVTQELIRQNLNPASYFSTRFFGPINELLGVYGAEKVFIEGDAIILGIHEYDQSPEEWYSVSRICGAAKEILDIVSSKNAQSGSTGLPTLELGIGICYENDRPLFLFDEDKPIMISNAIGDADRMSSCSWRLREEFREYPFNVEVLDMQATDSNRGEKGQSQIRYNLNGILMSNESFSKLKSEIQLRKLTVNIAGADRTMYVGRFPDTRGKERDLVIREGVVGLWDGTHARPGDPDGEKFYEVLPNSRTASQVLEVARNS